MGVDEWKELMEKWNAVILSKHDELHIHLSPDLLSKSWLGNPGTSIEQIQALEQRLDIQLPPGYRNFLMFTNGWNSPLTFAIDKLWQTSEVDWFRKRHQDWIDILLDIGSYEVPDDEYFVYGDAQATFNYRILYLSSLLEISKYDGEAILLLNPEVVTADGEWEAWFFAHWHPGAARYHSFDELMRDNFSHLFDVII